MRAKKPNITNKGAAEPLPLPLNCCSSDFRSSCTDFGNSSTDSRSSTAHTGGNSRPRRSRHCRPRDARTRCNRGRRTDRNSHTRPSALPHMFRPSKKNCRSAHRNRTQTNSRRTNCRNARRNRMQMSSRRMSCRSAHRNRTQTSSRSANRRGNGGTRSFHRTESNRANT